MAACTKVAAFGALLRVLYVAFEGVRWDFQPVLGAIAVLTMLVGAVLAVTQTDMKRLLAYSSIANAGYLLVGVLALNKEGLSSTMFYLVAYGFSVLAAFGVVSLVRDAEGEATHLSRWAGLGRKRHPADQRLHEQVRGVRRGDRRWADLAGDRRCDHEHAAGVPVPAGHRDDVAAGAEREHADGVDPGVPHLRGPGDRRHRDVRAGRGAGAAAGPHQRRGAVRPVAVSWR
jgi:hypothetical protein